MDEKPQKVVVETGSDFAANTGDEAYFAAMVDLFAEHLPGVEIVKFDGRPEAIAERYGVRAVYSGGKPWRRLRALWPTLREIATCDAYVFGGGQIVIDEHGLVSVPYRMARPMLASLLRRPVMSYAVGVGPLTGGLGRWLTKVCLRRFTLVTVRDRVSEELVRSVGFTGEIVRTIDAAVALESAGAHRARAILDAEGVATDRPILACLPWGPAYRCGKSLVPVILRRKRAARDAEGQRKYDRHVAIVAEALRRMVQEAGAYVLFVPPDPTEAHGGDLAMARDLHAALAAPEHSGVVEGDYSPKELKALLGQAELAVGSRMHGLILATGEAVPLVGICFSDKIRCWGEIVGQERFFIDEGQIASAEQLHRLIRGAWDARAALREQMAARRRELCDEVVANVKRLGRLLEARRR